MSNENYKRATIVVEPDASVDFQMEGKGPLILSQKQFRIMSMAATEMLKGSPASCWQDYVPDIGYIRVVKRKRLCDNPCTRQSMELPKRIKDVSRKRRIPVAQLGKINIPPSLKSFNFFNNSSSLKRRKKS